MLRKLTLVFAAAVIASFANAVVVFDSTTTVSAGGTTVVGAATGTTLVGYSDYVSTDIGPLMTLNTFSFVGGVAVAGGSVVFGFYDATGTVLINSFSSTLPSAGNFIWTISGLSATTPFNIASTGVVAMYTLNGSTGTFRYTASAPTVGIIPHVTTNAPVGDYYKFKFDTVPEPGSIAGMITAITGFAGFTFRRRK